MAVDSDPQLQPALLAFQETKIPQQILSAHATSDVFAQLLRITEALTAVQSKSLRSKRIVKQALDKIQEARCQLD